VQWCVRVGKQGMLDGPGLASRLCLGIGKSRVS
jgi:hypothetical protein